MQNCFLFNFVTRFFQFKNFLNRLKKNYSVSNLTNHFFLEFLTISKILPFQKFLKKIHYK